MLDLRFLLSYLHLIYLTLPTSPRPPHPPYYLNVVSFYSTLIIRQYKRYYNVTFIANYRLTTLYISNCVSFRLFLSRISLGRLFPAYLLPFAC